MSTSPELDKIIFDLVERVYGITDQGLYDQAAYKECRAAIDAHTAQKVQEARIDELTKCQRVWSTCDLEFQAQGYMEKRLATLSTQPQEEDVK